MKKLLTTPEGTFELELTVNEITQKQIDDEQEIVRIQKEEQEELAKLAKEEQEQVRKESAIAKLKALGLTEEEVKSIL
jgi:hypothetical protein